MRCFIVCLSHVADIGLLTVKMFHRKWAILSPTVFSLFYRFSMASSQSLNRVPAFNYAHACFVGNRQLRVRSRDLTNILETDQVQNEYRLKRQNCVNNHLQTILASKIFECLICKCIQFKETRFVTSSRAENHVTLYNTSVRSNKSNVNSSSFTTETNLFLFCKRDFLELYWGPLYQQIQALMHSSVALSIEHCCFLLSSTCFCYSTCIQLVGGMRKWMLRQFFLESDFPVFLMLFCFFFYLGFRKSSFRMLFMPLRLQWCLQDLVTIITNHVSQDPHHVTWLLPGLRLETYSLPILPMVLIGYLH